MGRAISIAGLVAVAVVLYGSGTSAGNLAGRFAAGQQRANRLQQAIRADSQRIQGYEGRIGDLEARLAVIQGTVDTQERLLGYVNAEVTAARDRLHSLDAQYARGRRVLAAELVADYEAPQPTLMDVVIYAQGWDDLLNRLSQLKSIARANADTIKTIHSTRLAVAVQARRLAQVQARRARATAAVVVERDEIAQLRLAIVDRELAVSRDRSVKSGQLGSLRRALAREAATLEQQAAKAQAASFASGGAPAGGCVNTPFIPHGGEFGFFQAPGQVHPAAQR